MSAPSSNQQPIGNAGATSNASTQGVSPPVTTSSPIAPGAAPFPAVGATRVWNGGTGDWSLSSNWTTSGAPNSYPLQGDTVRILSGSTVLHGSEALEGGTFDTYSVTLGSGTATTAATLTLDKAVVGASVAVTVAGDAAILATGTSDFEGPLTFAVSGGTLTLGSQSGGNLVFTQGVRGHSIVASGSETIVFNGNTTFEATSGFTAPSGVAIVNNGMINQVGADNTIDGSITGTGTFDLQFAASLDLKGSVSSGQTIHFGDVDGRVHLSDLAEFDGQITNFSAGNLIDVAKVEANGASFDTAAHTVTLTKGGAIVATVHNVYGTAGTLLASSDGEGGTTVSFANTPSRAQYEIAGGDRAMGSDLVRATMVVPGTSTPITGAGIKIGIISGSFNVNKGADEDARSGFLPATPEGKSAVHVLKEGAAGDDDEGRAMAELVHQVAPGAELYFAADGNSETDMADSVAKLRSVGCDVIVDDIRWFSTARSQIAGTIASAVKDAVDSGVDYFSCAYNTGHGFYQGNFSPSQVVLPDGSTVKANIFSNGTPYVPITLTGDWDTPIDLQWSAPYLGVDGKGAPNSLSFKLFSSSGQLIGTSTQATEDDGTPTADTFFHLQTKPATDVYYLVVYSNDGQPVPASFSINILANSADDSIDDPAATTSGGNVAGHELVPGVNTIGAIYYGQNAIFGQTPSTNEYFSDYGPGELLYDSNGNPLPAPQSAGKVNFTAPDGIQTTVGKADGGFKPFYGTSAAAPNAAAVAALMLQADGRLQTAQVSYLLAHSAIPFGTAPTQSGAGLIQAQSAVRGAIAAATVPIWTAQAGGTDWGTAGDWSNGALPGVNDTAQLTDGIGLLSGAYEVTYGLANGTIAGLVMDGGTTASPHLTIGAGAALAVTGTTTIGATGVLTVDGRFDSARVALAAGGSLVFDPAAAATFSGVLSGAGTLVKTGLGTLTLSSASSYGGGTALAAGTLELGTAISAGTGAITFGSGRQVLQIDAALAGGTLFGNVLSGVGIGDVLDLRGLRYAAGATATMSGSILTVTSRGTSNAFTLSGNATATFGLVADGYGGTQVTAYAPGSLPQITIDAPAPNARTSIIDPTIAGTAQAGTTVTVTSGALLLGSTVVAADGSWSLKAAFAADGTYAVTAGSDLAIPASTRLTIDSQPNRPLFGTVATDVSSIGGKIYALYETILGRAPDPIGFERQVAAVAAGTSFGTIAESMLGSSEYAATYGSSVASDSGFVDRLYRNGLHRTADADGLQHWDAALADGRSRGQVALDIATSSESSADLAATFQAGVFVPDASDAAVARLYYGLLNRAPDAAGLQDYERAVHAGASLGQLTGYVLGSAEYATTAAGRDNRSYIEGFYRTALGREGDAAGLELYETGLDTGTMSRADVARGFLTSAEFQADEAGRSNASYIDTVYQAALGRHAEAAGLDYWEDALAGGASRKAVARGIVGSAEFAAHATNPGQASFINALYEGALGRAAGAGEIQGWQTAIANGTSLGAVAAGIAESPEAIGHLASRIEAGFHIAG